MMRRNVLRRNSRDRERRTQRAILFIASALAVLLLLWAAPFPARAAEEDAQLGPGSEAGQGSESESGLGPGPETRLDAGSEIEEIVAGPAMVYENPKDILIQAPGLTYSTTARQISIYGACDFDYPLYLNGKQLNTTENGFFAEFVSLNEGANTFTLTNNGKSKTVTITRKQAGAGSGSGTKINIWGSDAKAKYGVVDGHNISRMAAPGTDGQKLLMPLAKGTVVQLTGDAGNLYRLSDGTFVYKSNLKVSEGTLKRTVISAAELVPLTLDACTELRLKVDQNALYNLEMQGSRAVLTVYNTKHSTALPEIPQNKILKSITVMADGSGGNAVYSLNFKDQAPINGYYVEFSDGYMEIGFKHRPILNGTDLTGVRVHIDAGHGGSDTGSLGAAGTFGPKEKEINLSIALGIQRYLESKGAQVTMTRTGDTTMGLAARAYQVAMEKPDLCLSVHCNSMPVTADYNKTKGLLTFYSLDHKNDATIINDALAKNMGIEAKAPRHSNLAMTRMTAYPSVLFESAFMSNPEDYQWLIRQDTQRSYGLAAGKAVETYFNRVGMLKDVEVVVDGQKLELEQPPILKEGRVLVPFRAVFEALGAQVDWQADTQTVTAQKGDTEVSLTIDGKSMTVIENGAARVVELEVPAQIVNGRTLVPGRAAAEALDATVSWDAAGRTVIIQK